MARLHHIVVTALKDHVHVVTAKKQLQYRKVEGLPNGGMPENQDERYENTHGVTLQLDQVAELDLRDDQLDYFRGAVSRGEIECDGLPPVPAPQPAAKAASK
jgi:homoserine dehydrogenase